MIIVWGNRWGGRVDEVPGVFYVAMRFGHLWYLPLIPLETCLVFTMKDQPIEGLKISLRPLCWLLAYLRPALVFFGSINVTFGVMMLTDDKLTDAVGEGVLSIAFGLTMLAAALWTWRSKSVRFASYTRAHELADQLELPESLRKQIDEAFGATTDAKIAELSLAPSRSAFPRPVVVSLGLLAMYILYFIVAIAMSGP